MADVICPCDVAPAVVRGNSVPAVPGAVSVVSPGAASGISPGAASGASPATGRAANILPPGPLLARLIEEAGRACRRDGVPPTQTALAARIGARIGMPAEQVAIRLSRRAAAMPPPPALPALLPISAPASQQQNPTWWRHLSPLAEEVLGERERQVFFGRCLQEPDPARPAVPGGGRLGAALNARFWQTEISARRKMAIALARLGRDPFAG